MSPISYLWHSHSLTASFNVLIKVVVTFLALKGRSRFTQIALSLGTVKLESASDFASSQMS